MRGLKAIGFQPRFWRRFAARQNQNPMLALFCVHHFFQKVKYAASFFFIAKGEYVKFASVSAFRYGVDDLCRYDILGMLAGV